MDDGKGYKTNSNGVDHQAKAYVAPKKPLVPNTSSNVTGKGRVWLGLGYGVSNVHISGTVKAPGSGGPKPKPKWGGADTCPRCDKSVFIAEMMRAAGQTFHKSCFTCQVTSSTNSPPNCISPHAHCSVHPEFDIS